MENALALYAVERHMNYIEENDMHFSVAAFQSKCFPIVVRYFNMKKGCEMCYPIFMVTATIC